MANISTKEKAQADQLAKYENKWVAIDRTRSGETIVASGKHITDAKRAAEKKGFKNAVYSKVPSSSKVFLA